MKHAPDPKTAQRAHPAPPLAPESLQEAVDWAIVSRRSIRALLPTPVPAAAVTIDRVMQRGSFIDCGMFLQGVMVAACARPRHLRAGGLMQYHRGITGQLQIPDTELLVCGMSLGHADPPGIENALVNERVSVDQFTTFHGGESNR